MELGQLLDALRQHVVELDKVEFLVPRPELSDSGPKLPNGQPSETLCLSEGGPALGIREPDAHGTIGPIPERGGTGGACFGHDQRDDGGGVEVRDHRRWSAMRSETVPVPLI